MPLFHGSSECPCSCCWTIEQIDRVADASRPYTVDGFSVDKVLVLRIGAPDESFEATSKSNKASRTFPIDRVSNQPITDKEFQMWCAQVKTKLRHPLPTIEWAKNRGEQMRATR